MKQTYLAFLFLTNVIANAGQPVKTIKTEVESNSISPEFAEEWGNDCSIYCALDLDSIKVYGTSHLKPKGRLGYEGQKAHDFNFSTAWVEGDSTGYGIGEKLIYEISQHSSRLGINKIFIANGYHKSKKIWEENSRVKKLRVLVDGNPLVILELKDDMSFQKADLPLIKFKEKGILKIEFQIEDIYPGSLYKDVAISELNFDGIGHH